MLKTLVSGAIYNVLNILVQVVLGLLVFREMLTHFGEVDFGNWTIMFAILAHVQLFEFGLGTMVSKLVPLINKEDNAENTANFSTAFFTIQTISILFLTLIIIVATNIDQSNFAFQAPVPLGWLVFLLGCNFILIFHTGALHAYLNGSFKVGRLNAVRLMINITRALLIIILLQFGFGVLTVAIIFFACALTEFLCLFAISLRLGLAKQLDLQSGSLASLKTVAKRGAKLFFVGANKYTIQNAPVMVCGFVLGALLVVPLRIAGRLMEIYVEVALALNYLLTPYFSSISSGDSRSFNNSFLISILSATCLSSVIFFNILFVGELFLEVWLGKVPEYTFNVLSIVAIGFFIQNMQGPCSSVLLSKNKDKTLMGLSICEITLLLSSIYPFITAFGVLGAAYSICLSVCVTRAVIQPIVMSKTLNISYITYVRYLIVPAFLLGGVLFGLQRLSMVLIQTDATYQVLGYLGLQGLVTICIGITVLIKKNLNNTTNMSS